MVHRHCPYCDSTAVVGLGAYAPGATEEDAAQTLVELRCGECGKLFLSDDRREPAKVTKTAT